MFAEGFERRDVESSMTSSCNSDAVCINSVISASRLCDGRISESPGRYRASSEADRGRFSAGFASFSKKSGEMDELTVCCEGGGHSLGNFGVRAVARDMSSTSIGRTYFPSDCV